MGVTHGASFPGKQTQTREPGSARGGRVGEANPPQRGWRTDQWRVAGGGARRPAAKQGLEAGGLRGLRAPERRRQGRAAASGRRGGALGARKERAGQETAAK